MWPTPKRRRAGSTSGTPEQQSTRPVVRRFTPSSLSMHETSHLLEAPELGAVLGDNRGDDWADKMGVVSESEGGQDDLQSGYENGADRLKR